LSGGKDEMKENGRYRVFYVVVVVAMYFIAAIWNIE
jgi:hypothetical protein